LVMTMNVKTIQSAQSRWLLRIGSFQERIW
jgi:hypothetical protein